MNAVELKSHGWKLVLSAGVAVTSGLLIVSVVLDLPTVPISAAFGGASPSQPLERVDCASLAPEGQTWHSVDIDLAQSTPGQSKRDGRADDRQATIDLHVGSAALTIAPPTGSDPMMRWHSEMGIDAAIIRTPTRSRVQRFGAERFDGDHPGFDDGEVEGLTLCYDLELTVNSDANPSLTRAYEWSIDETVEPAHWELSAGAEGVSTYEISVNRDAGTEGAWRVKGTITIDNFTPSDIELESVDNIIDGGIISQVDCGVEVAGYVLESGESLACEYHSDLPDASERTTTAKVRTNGDINGATTTSTIDFDRAEVHKVGHRVFVTNNTGRSWTFHNSGSSVYERTFRCESDAGLHPSAVRIAGTDKRSSTSVSVDCRPGETPPTASRPDQR